MGDLAADATRRFRDGDLSGSLASVTSAVKQAPADPRLRVFLSQILMVQGDWKRALSQLKLLAELDASALPMVHGYRAAILCEQLREAVFAGERTPKVLGDPPQWIALQLQSLQQAARGRFLEAGELRERAWDECPELRGEVDGGRFSSLSDSDTRIGPVIEALIDGSYFWIPLERVREIGLEEPKDIRDLVWLPAEFRWDNGGTAVGFIPSRYPGSAAAEESLALARRTEWRDEAGDCVHALGQRVWATDERDYSMFEVRKILIDG